MQVVGDAVGQDGLALAGRGLADTTAAGVEPAGHLAGHCRHQRGRNRAPRWTSLIVRLQELRRDLPEGDRLADVFRDARSVARRN